MTFKFGGNIVSYKRVSSSYAVLGGETLIECDTDAGPLTLTLPAAPVPLEQHEVWLSTTGGPPVTINGNGIPINGPASITVPFKSLLLTWIPPLMPGGGSYWYSRE